MKRRLLATLFILLACATGSGIFISQYDGIRTSVEEISSVDYSNNLVRTLLASNYAIHYNLESNEGEKTPSYVFLQKKSDEVQFNVNEGEDPETKKNAASSSLNYVSGSLDTSIQQWNETLKNDCQNLLYYAVDNTTGEESYSTNIARGIMPSGDVLRPYVDKIGKFERAGSKVNNSEYKYQWLVTLQYDELGTLSVKNQMTSRVEMTDMMVRYDEKLFLYDSFPSFFTNPDDPNYYSNDMNLTNSDVEAVQMNFQFNKIKNTTIVFAIPERFAYSDAISGILGFSENGYYWTESASFLIGILIVLMLIAFIVPVKLLSGSMLTIQFSKIPLDILTILSFIVSLATIEGVKKLIPLTYPDRALLVFNSDNMIFPYAANFLFMMMVYLFAVLTVISFKKAAILGWKSFLKQTFIYKILHNLRNGTSKIVRYLDSIDLKDTASMRLIGVIIANFFLLSMIYFFFSQYGVSMKTIFLLFIYSIVLFVISRNYMTKVRTNYHDLLKVTKNIAEGNLDQEVQQDLGIFNSFKEDITSIRHSFKNAIDEEVKSQKMKTELISNVSHDLKTPLTSIITYTDLLKQDNLSEEDRKEYLLTLERSEARLKHLIEDLFEVSRVNSGNVQLNIQEIDIISLISQVLIEHEDKIQTSGLNMRTNFSDEKIMLHLDSQKTFRVLANLITNITKYAMPNSRVYIDVTDYGEQVELSFKNMSATEIDFDPNEIVDRFVRGDKSRNTEGSGLGLAIAKSFTELQGGSFRILIDGDLFKAIMRFPKQRD